MTRSPDGAARLRPRRVGVLLLFLPLFATLQAIHWLGFLLDDLLFRGWRRVSVRAPVMVLGVPRSGTTRLHQVLAEDPQFTTFRTWECLFAPSVTERRFWRALGRIDAALGGGGLRVLMRLERRVFGKLDEVHAMGLTTPEEDYFALMPVLSCFILALPFPQFAHIWRVGRFDRDLSARERERLLNFYENALKRHLYVHGPEKTLLSKNAAFAPLAHSLATHFPDARFIVCLRDPVATVPSQLSAVADGLAFFGVPPDSLPVRARLVEQLLYSYENLDALRRRLPPERHVAIGMERLRTRLADTLADVYRRFDLPLSPTFAARLAAEDRAARNYRSGHRYDLEQYGFSEEMIQQRFAIAYAQPALMEEGAVAPARAPAARPRPQVRAAAALADRPREALTARDLRVAIVSDAAPERNGVGTYYHDLAAHLRAAGARVELISPRFRGGRWYGGLALPLPGDPTQRFLFPSPRLIERRLRRLAPTVVIVPTPGPFGVLGLLFARRYHAALVVGFHTHFERLTELNEHSAGVGFLARGYLNGCNRLLFRAGRCTLANSPAMVQVAEEMGARHAALMGTSVPKRFLDQPTVPLRLPPQRVVFAGRLAPEKNLTAVVEAAAALPEVAFSIAGEGPLRSWVEGEAARLPNLEYVGLVERRKVLSLIDAHDLLVLPSSVESFGTIALEAMARGRLVVVSSQCGILSWGLLRDGLFSVDDGETLAATLARVCALDPALLERKAATARAAAHELNDRNLHHWLQVLGLGDPHGLSLD